MLPLFLTLVLQAPVAPAPLPQIEGKALAEVPGPIVPETPDVALAGLSPDDIQGKMRRQARRSGLVPCVALPLGPVEVLDAVPSTTGWKAYRLEVEPRAKVHARLRGDHEAWFKVSVVNKWGKVEEGMLQNAIHTGNPEASYQNPKAERMTIYLLVDTTEVSGEREPFRLQVTYP